jgi:hypothetical protein
MATVPESPGVYITESLTPLTNNNIPGEAVGVFAAAYTQGPDIPTLVTSWNQYVQQYGTFAQASPSTSLHYAVYQFFNNGGSRCIVLAIPNTDAVTASLTAQDINSPADNVMTISAISPGQWGNSTYVAISSAGNTGRFNLQVYYGGTASSNLVENFIDLSINPADARYVSSYVNSPTYGSNYINVKVTLPGTYAAGIDDPALISATPLAGGSNGVTAPNLATTIPLQLDKLQGQILSVNAPGVYTAATVNALITWAEGRGDVMLVVDGPPPSFPETSAQVVQNYINLITGGSPIDNSTYATIYAPWIQIVDPASSVPGAARWVPPGGAVLGIWSRTDTAVGVWQTPAGVSFGAINLVNLEALFTSSDLDTLNVNNINAIRFVPNYFPAIMGGRTLEQGYPDRYVAVRRMLVKLEHDFTYLLQPALFEPNNAQLWLQITSIITNYLTQLMQAGALGGTTPNTAFQVICDTSNNTPATAAAGIVNVSVAVALLSPAEFILINISQFQNTGTTTITTSPTPA